jgi:hypothetical protein
MRTFLMVTGPKTDLWLVRTVGLLLAVIGALLLYAQMTGDIHPPVIALAMGSVLSLTLVEIVHVTKRVISPIYLGDAAVEIVLLIGWSIALLAV